VTAAASEPAAAPAPAKKAVRKAAARKTTAAKATPTAETPAPDVATPTPTTEPAAVPAAEAAPAAAAPAKVTPVKKVAAKKAPAKRAPATNAAPATKKVAAAGTTEKTSVRVTVTEPISPEPAAAATGAQPTATDAPAANFDVLAKAAYLSITTFRKSGTPVPTPIWAAQDKGNIVFRTGSESGKIKRLRHTQRVTVAPCDRRGQLLGEPVQATARILPKNELARVNGAMRAKYGWQFRISALGSEIARILRIKPHGQTGVELTLD
jgi:PPOX class probable F420-dependent enzyme